jgi:hypothetical protein
MAVALEAYTTEGLLTGSVVADGRLVDLLASFSTMIVENGVQTPFQGPPQRTTGWSSVDVDALLAVVAAPETVTPFHAVWHALAVDIGPYRIHGELPALPGFDPAKALARPTGAFILVGRVTLELRDEGLGAGVNEHAYVWINRYAVDAVFSDLELGFFFPGALDEAAQRAIAIA